MIHTWMLNEHSYAVHWHPPWKDWSGFLRPSLHEEFQLENHRCSYRIRLDIEQQMLHLSVEMTDPGGRKHPKTRRLSQVLKQTDRPKSVTVLGNGEKRQLGPASGHKFGPTSWKVTNDPGKFPYKFTGYDFFKYPVLELFIEFQFHGRPDERNAAAQRLCRLLETQWTSDVRFIVQGEVISAHVDMLTTGLSPVLAAMFRNDFVEKRTGTVEVEDVSPEVFKRLLCYLYTGAAGDLEQDLPLTRALLTAADKYQIESLKKMCQQNLQSQEFRTKAGRLLEP